MRPLTCGNCPGVFTAAWANTNSAEGLGVENDGAKILPAPANTKVDLPFRAGRKSRLEIRPCPYRKLKAADDRLRIG